MNGNLGYRYEDRPTSVVGSGADDTAAATEEVNEEQYRAGLGVSYTFWQHYTASADYTFTTQESDLGENDYDDHRIVLSLSWQQDLMRW